MISGRSFTITLLMILGISASLAPQEKAEKAEAVANQCKAKPFAYDHGPVGQQTWCGACNDGSLRQAPINIVPSSAAGGPDQSDIQFHGYNIPADLVIYPNNPYNLKVDYAEGKSSITIGGDTYKLVEFHFHRPSEEAIDNRRYAMVWHLVHLNERAGCKIGMEGCVAVLAVLIKQGTPKPETTTLLETLLRHLPPPSGNQHVPINLDLFPKYYDKAGYYRYEGSLTTPPCTENITFYVLKTPLQFSPEQLAQFERHYPSPNARDLQPNNDREITQRPQPGGTSK